jgi:di/tricarboxylate transporter
MALYFMPTAALFVVAFAISAGVTLSKVGTQWRHDLIQIFAWGAALAVVGFAVGFLGPAVLSASPQGPLLGIFVTGPAGAALGCVLGAVRSVRKAERHDGRT